MRIINRLVAALVALALLVGGLLVAIEIVIAGRHSSPWILPHDQWYQDLRVHTWRASSIRWVLFAIALVGLILLLLQLIRRRPLGLRLQQRDRNVDVEVARRSLEQYLARAARRVQGIAWAKVRVVRGKAKVTAGTPRRTPEGLSAEVREAVSGALADLGLVQAPKVSVSIRGRD